MHGDVSPEALDEFDIYRKVLVDDFFESPIGLGTNFRGALAPAPQIDNIHIKSLGGSPGGEAFEAISRVENAAIFDGAVDAQDGRTGVFGMKTFDVEGFFARSDEEGIYKDLLTIGHGAEGRDFAAWSKILKGFVLKEEFPPVLGLMGMI